jgi:hypothetical protein
MAAARFSSTWMGPSVRPVSLRPRMNSIGTIGLVGFVSLVVVGWMGVLCVFVPDLVRMLVLLEWLNFGIFVACL